MKFIAALCGGAAELGPFGGGGGRELMTEAEWLALLEDLLASVPEPAALRFTAACCRRAWHLMDDRRHCAAVVAAEALADGRITAEEFEHALAPVIALWADLPLRWSGYTVPYERWQPWQHLTGATRHLGSVRAAPWAAVFVARAAASGAGAHRSQTWIGAWLEEVAAQRVLLASL